MADYLLEVEDGDVTRACNDLLKRLMGPEKLEAVMAPKSVPSRSMVFDVLVSDPGELDAAPFAPVLPVSTAASLSRMTRVKASDRPMGVVMRPCQIRALVELVKLNQASLENLVIIGVDCPGTFSVTDYGEMCAGGNPTAMVLDKMEEEGSESGTDLRPACLACPDPVPSNADIVFGLYGMERGAQVLVQTLTPAGEGLLKGSKLKKQKDMRGREEAVEAVRGRRAEYRAGLKEKSGAIAGIEAVSGFYDRCVNCHNCMKACPICYCRECLFDSDVFDMEAYRYADKARARGQFKMPSDSMLFHLGRMNHMILSCVGCGLCEQACPSGIPLMDVIIPVADNAQRELDYVPGRSQDEKAPMLVYREDEYSEIGDR